MDMDDKSKSVGQADDNLLEDINNSLAKQINDEFEVNVMFGTAEDLQDRKIKRKKKIPTWLKVSSIVFTAILVIGLGGLFYLNSLYGSMNIDSGAPVKQQAEIFEQDEEAAKLDEMKPEDVQWNDSSNVVRKEEEVINILLVGEEAMKDGPGRGRTDSIMIATINEKQNSLKLSSIMRDTYVQIPGYSDNKLNAAYHNGGMPLLADTIKRNFDIEVDGYILVDFDGFEKVIDKLGGVEVTLSQTEASYLNRTNYISNPSNRNVSAGTHTLNGNQALGYARVRYVPNGDQSDDFGRTSRQREVLNAIFDKYKSKNAIELIAMLPDMLSLVTTDIQKDEFVDYITKVVTLGANELQTFRLPVDDAFKCTRIRGMSVLLPEDLQTNIDALHEFIFGKDEMEPSPSPSVSP